MGRAVLLYLLQVGGGAGLVRRRGAARMWRSCPIIIWAGIGDVMSKPGVTGVYTRSVKQNSVLVNGVFNWGVLTAVGH